ncbi:MAG: hypothetical protein KGL26_03370 [Pseudomonadota bacterium]|nr:hypothetical protein [Pseudomonadota bacterium]
MVDSIPSANGVRKVGTGAARHRTSPGVTQQITGSMAIEQIAATANAGARNPGEDKQDGPGDTPNGDARGGLTLEISEDGGSQQIVYRFLDARTGQVVGEWSAGELDKLREYLQAKNLHILDKKI